MEFYYFFEVIVSIIIVVFVVVVISIIVNLDLVLRLEGVNFGILLYFGLF